MENTKIRSWNKLDNQFYYFQDGRYYKDSECTKCISERICNEFIWRNAEYFTGLTDKNGKDIYEGDVNEDKGIVIWNKDDASFCWEYEDIEIQPMGSEDEWCNIIGNIHGPTAI